MNDVGGLIASGTYDLLGAKTIKSEKGEFSKVMLGDRERFASVEIGIDNEVDISKFMRGDKVDVQFGVVQNGFKVFIKVLDMKKVGK